MPALHRLLPSRSLARSFSLSTPTLASPSYIRQAAHGHGHAVPPEGDINHGRSAYGFQSHDRHEHFTFPEEEKYVDHPGWSNAKYAQVTLAVILTGLAISYMPPRPTLDFKPNDPSFVTPSSTAKTGPDDTRPYLVRLVQYWTSSSQSLFEEKLQELEAEREKAERLQLSYQHQAEVRRANINPLSFDSYRRDNVLPGDILDVSDAKVRTLHDKYTDVGVDPKANTKFQY